MGRARALPLDNHHGSSTIDSLWVVSYRRFTMYSRFFLLCVVSSC